LQVFEAQPVPYTAEELALMRKSEPRLAVTDPRAGRKSARELPPDSAKLVAEAQRRFKAREFDKAEESYLQLLRKDDRNAPALADLAVIQMEMNRLEEAENQVRRALAVAPDDAYALSVLGQVKLRQDKYDEALDSLGRAAQLDPQSAEIQNFLGVTLNHKGLRGPAETALRKAIQLDPGYAVAHNNLAVIYLAQNPPMVELARWHYQKALAAGLPPNPELEKGLDAKQPPAAQP
jgi:Flp pilus assembly protein TadD